MALRLSSPSDSLDKLRDQEIAVTHEDPLIQFNKTTKGKYSLDTLDLEKGKIEDLLAILIRIHAHFSMEAKKEDLKEILKAASDVLETTKISAGKLNNRWVYSLSAIGAITNIAVSSYCLAHSVQLINSSPVITASMTDAQKKLANLKLKTITNELAKFSTIQGIGTAVSKVFEESSSFLRRHLDNNNTIDQQGIKLMEMFSQRLQQRETHKGRQYDDAEAQLRKTEDARHEAANAIISR